jgi:type IV pilus assembly protein PilC
MAGRPHLQLPLNPKQMILFTRQLNTLLEAGLHLIRALEISARQVQHPGFKAALNSLAGRVASGASLAAAMSAWAEFFPPLYINLVHVGEVSGALSAVLSKTAAYLEREHELKMKVRSASLYPALMLILAGAAFGLILLFVLPVFADLFRDAGVALPGLTRLMLAASVALTHNWPFLLAALFLLAGAGGLGLRTEKGRHYWHRCLVQAPLLGRINRELTSGRLTFVLALMVRAGIPLLQALAVAREVMENVCYQEALSAAEYRVLSGVPLSQALAESTLFDATLLAMLEVGEETGALDDMLQSMADYYDSEVKYRMDTVVSLIEPLFILLVGALIGTVVIATLLPMFSFMDLL